MPLEVQTAGMPAARHRALIFSVVLLALTCTLAGSMVRRASRRVLGLRVAPPGWAISFQPPHGYRPRETTDAGATSVLGFIGATGGGAVVALTVQCWEIAPQVDSETVARRISRELAAQHQGDPRYPRPRLQVERIGTLEAVEIFNEQIATVVRVVVLPDGRALALSLRVHRASLDMHMHVYRLFDLTCRSVVCE